jgi:glyoxylase I family protein
VENLEESVAELAKLGVVTEPIRVDEHTGRRFTFFADPDDLPLELYQL